MIIDPIMNAFLDNEIQDVQYHGSDYELPESRAQVFFLKHSVKNIWEQPGDYGDMGYPTSQNRRHTSIVTKPRNTKIPDIRLA
ncbi:unnamed protein product [Mucor circinelloides]